MPYFQPPTIDDVSPVLAQQAAPWPRGPIEYRLFAHFKNRARGRTLILLNTGCVVEGPFDWPPQLVNVDPSQGDVWTEQGLAGIPYTEIDQVFMGGHIYHITDAEAACLTTAGYGSGISNEIDNWSDAGDNRDWNNLHTWGNP